MQNAARFYLGFSQLSVLVPQYALMGATLLIQGCLCCLCSLLDILQLCISLTS